MRLMRDLRHKIGTNRPRTEAVFVSRKFEQVLKAKLKNQAFNRKSTMRGLFIYM